MLRPMKDFYCWLTHLQTEEHGWYYNTFNHIMAAEMYAEEIHNEAQTSDKFVYEMFPKNQFHITVLGGGLEGVEKIYKVEVYMKPEFFVHEVMKGE